MEVKLGTRVLSSLTPDNLRMACLIWGHAGCGKTTLAATAPGKKLWLNFDPDGMLSLLDRGDIVPFDMSGDPHAITERFKDDNPFQMEQTLREHMDIETVVFDSLTTFSLLATDNAVSKNAKPGKNQISLEAPGQVGYTHRNALTLRAFISIMRLTKRMNRHFIVTTHEGAPVKSDDEKTTLYIPPTLSVSLMNQIALNINEVWHLEHLDTGDRRILVRPAPARKYKPVKTRMWNADKSPEFTWRYDANTQSGEGISEWFTKWQQNNGRRLQMPT